MKQTIKVVALFFVMTAFAFNPPKHKIVGRWIGYENNGAIGGTIDFKKDGSYDIMLPNGQIGEVGNYKLNNSTFSLKNAKAVCGIDYWGSYKITFYGNDSVSFSLIEDSCSTRREDIVGGNPGLKRLKMK